MVFVTFSKSIAKNMADCDCQCHESTPEHLDKVSHGCRKTTQVVWTPSAGKGKPLNKSNISTHSHFCEPKEDGNGIRGSAMERANRSTRFSGRGSIGARRSFGGAGVGGREGFFSNLLSALKIGLASFCAFVAFIMAKEGWRARARQGSCPSISGAASADEDKEVNLDFLVKGNGWKLSLVAILTILGAVTYWRSKISKENSGQDFSKLFFLLGALVSTSFTVLYFSSSLSGCVVHWHQLFRFNPGVLISVLAAFGFMVLAKDVISTCTDLPLVGVRKSK